MADAKRDSNYVPTMLATSNADGVTPVLLYADPTSHRLLIDLASGVTSVSVVTANGISGTVATPTTTPAITLTLGAITPTSINGLTITANGTNTLNIAAGKTLTVSKTLTLTAPDDTGIYTFPTGTATLLATNGSGASLTGIPYALTGTANQVILSASTGNITFSLPQSIGTSSNPQFATIELGAASDTTLARVSAGVISVEGVRIIADAGTTSGTILKNNGTTFVASTETYATPGTSGNVMTSDGTNWTSAVPAGGTPTFVMTGDFSASGRIGSDVSGGILTFNTTGLSVDTTSTTTRYANATITTADSTSGVRPFAGTPTFSTSFFVNAIGATGDTFIGIGAPTVATTGITYTPKSIGFRSINKDLTVYISDGSTITTSASLGTLALNDFYEVAFKVNSASVDFYYKKNYAASYTKVTVSATLPTGGNTDTSATLMQFSCSNHSAANQTKLIFSSYYFAV